MKKVLYIILSLTMLLSSIALPMSASAGESTDSLSATISEQMIGGAEFLLKGVESFTASQAVDFLMFLDSGYDMSAYTDGFIDSISAQLADNDGSLAGADLGTYGAIITVLQRLGYNPASFDGVDLVAQFEAMDPTFVYSPYYYRVAIEAAEDNFAIKLCDQFINDYYTMGMGVNYWGYSCDSTAVLLTSIAGYSDRYADVIKDARRVIAKHTNDDGCCYDMTYTDTSPDSTAVAMMAYSAIGAMALASAMYNDLVSGYQSTPGVMQYYGEDNYYATKDALLALEYYSRAVAASGYAHSMVLATSDYKACTGGTRIYRCSDCGRTVSYKYPVSASHTYSAKKVKPTYTAKGYTLHTCSVCGKQYKDAYKAKLTLATPADVKLTAVSKGFKVSHKRVSAATGYQVEYSLSKKFTNAKRCTYANNKKLTTSHTKKKGGKRYYVRVRSYKKITSGGKTIRVYSSWSKTKSIVTKK